MASDPSNEAQQQPEQSWQRTQASAGPTIDLASSASPLRWLEMVAVLAWTVLADLLIYRLPGFCTTAVFVCIASSLLTIVRVLSVEQSYDC